MKQNYVFVVGASIVLVLFFGFSWWMLHGISSEPYISGNTDSPQTPSSPVAQTPTDKIVSLTASTDTKKSTIPATDSRKSQASFRIQSIDTMKYSRDRAREALGNPSYDTIMERQIKEIADTGATHAAIATPYDEEFIPVLTRWVNMARKYNMHVWFRGNWSGWEGWFDYAKIGRDEHFTKTEIFIRNHADLFQDGDIFMACPECENGGPGDPRSTGDAIGFRKFLINEYTMTQKEFTAIGKKVDSRYTSMNGDVARLIMDKATTKALGGVVTIDHYVATTQKLADDIKQIAKDSGGKVMLGEIGVPIPDIHGNMTEAQQAAWLEDALSKLSAMPEVDGINYWVNVDGSTQLWTEEGTPRSAVSVLTKYFGG